MEHTDKEYAPARGAIGALLAIAFCAFIGMIAGSFAKQQTLGVLIGTVGGLVIGFVLTVVIGKRIAE